MINLIYGVLLILWSAGLSSWRGLRRNPKPIFHSESNHALRRAILRGILKRL